MPKRTGRRRKRGSQDDFQEPSERREVDDEELNDTSQRLLQSLRSNPSDCTVQVAGNVAETFSFKGLDDG